MERSDGGCVMGDGGGRTVGKGGEREEKEEKEEEELWELVVR